MNWCLAIERGSESLEQKLLQLVLRLGLGVIISCLKNNQVFQGLGG